MVLPISQERLEGGRKWLPPEERNDPDLPSDHPVNTVKEFEESDKEGEQS